MNLKIQIQISFSTLFRILFVVSFIMSTISTIDTIDTIETIDLVKLIITSISLLDFCIFSGFFIYFLALVPFKSKETSSKCVSIIILVIFLLYKGSYIPIFLSTIPFVNLTISNNSIILGVLTWVNVLVSGVTLIFALTTLFVYYDPTYEILQSFNNKTINIIMPIYNENPESLLKAINSVISIDYPKHLIRLYLAFDEGVKENIL